MRGSILKHCQGDAEHIENVGHIPSDSICDSSVVGDTILIFGKENAKKFEQVHAKGCYAICY